MAAVNKGLYAITDFSLLADDEVLSKTEHCLRAGLSLLQYRDKSDKQDLRIQRALALQDLCREFNTPFIVNDDIQLAASIKADGVHVGKDDTDIAAARDYLGPVIIGHSCYNRLDLGRRAQKDGADYIAFGAFYPTISKSSVARATPDLLAKAKKEIRLPIVAIGGITPENGKVLIEKGADLLAVISALYGVEDTISAMDKFKPLFK